MVTDYKEHIDIEQLNFRAAENLEDLVRDSEQRYLTQIRETVDSFCSTLNRNKIILLAGPSSSGKTTTSYILQKELHDRGVKTLPISLDDFYKPREAAPFLPDGTQNLELPELVDTDYLAECLNELQKRGRFRFPIFDFVKGRRSEKERELQFDEHTAIIIEGLHALNPLITEKGLCQNALKLYISIKSEYYLQNKRMISTREMRLVRRLIRDYNFRGCSPADTLAMWKNVVDGEDLYIRPFRTGADFWIDSLHLYEPLAYHGAFLELMWEIDEQNPYYGLAEQLKAAMDCFPQMDLTLIPKDSMLREFIILP